MRKISTLFILFILTGCLPYKMSTEEFQTLRQRELELLNPIPVTNEEIALHEQELRMQDDIAKHWLYKFIPRHRSLIQWYDLPHWISWGLIGNDDDGLFGEMFLANRMEEREFKTKDARTWAVRNPLHNFCFYVIGQAYLDRQDELSILRLGAKEFKMFKHKPVADTVFISEETSSLYMCLHSWKPFISLRIHQPGGRRGDFYFGWRERGNFGMKFIPSTKHKKDKTPKKEEEAPAVEDLDKIADTYNDKEVLTKL